MTDDDSKLQKQLADTLDRSLNDLDEHTMQQLQDIRLQAQRPPRRHWRPALAAAASILVMIAVPWLVHKTPTQDISPKFGEPVLSSSMFGDSHLSVDPEMLAEWEMLEAIGEVPDA